MSVPDFTLEPDTVLERVVGVFQAVGIEYVVGGSTASNNFGRPRLTHDVDFAARIPPEKVSALAAAFGDDFYADEDMIRTAVETTSSFNVIYLPFSFKADIFIAPDDEWTAEQFARRHEVKTFSSGFRYFVSSPEDIILQKLRWFELGGRISENQWRDIQEMLNVQRGNLDHGYLRRWAQTLGLGELLDEAVRDADASLGSS